MRFRNDPLIQLLGARTSKHIWPYMVYTNIYNKVVTPILVLSLQYICIHELIIFVAITVGRGKERGYKEQREVRVTAKSQEHALLQ